MSSQDSFIPFARTVTGPREVAAVKEVLDSGWLTTGPKTREFETKFAQACGAKYAVAVNSCTAALHLSLVALGIKPGDEVIVPTMTFTATAEVVTYLGATPVFVDCDPRTFLISTDDIKRKITKRTRALIPVHYGGQACDITLIQQIAKRYNLKIIWDAAHAFPTLYKGKSVGNYPDLACFSFYATKTISTGEGGMIVTNNKKYAERARIASLHGMSRNAWGRYAKNGSWRYDVVMPGFKYNLTDLAAALGLVQLSRAEEFQKKREAIARRYQQAFADIPELEILEQTKESTHAWHLFVVKLRTDSLRISRDEFVELLHNRGIGTSVHFIPLHLHSYWKKTYKLRANNFPHTTKAFGQILSLPIYPTLTDRETKYVVNCIKEIISNNKSL